MDAAPAEEDPQPSQTSTFHNLDAPANQMQQTESQKVLSPPSPVKQDVRQAVAKLDFKQPTSKMEFIGRSHVKTQIRSNIQQDNDKPESYNLSPKHQVCKSMKSNEEKRLQQSSRQTN